MKQFFIVRVEVPTCNPNDPFMKTKDLLRVERSIERLVQKNTERLTRILSFKRDDDKLIELQSKYNLIEFV